MVGRDADPYLSPYTWLLGVTSRVTGVDGIQVLAAAGLVNLVLALAGLYRLVTALSPRWLAPPLTLVFTLFAWGTPPWRWAGFLNANSIGTVLPLGSTFATALAYFALAAIWRWLRSGSRADLVLVGVTTPVIITCHPFTATWTAAIGLGFVVAGADRGNRRRVIRLAGVAAGAAAVAVAWPFYPVVDLPVASGGFRAINEAVFHQVIPRTFLALPGVLALWWRYRQRRRDPLVLGFACVTTVYAIGWILDRPTLGRVLPAVVLILHVALADLVAHLLEDARPARHRSVTIVVASVAIAVGVVTTAAGTVRALPRALLPASLADRRELRSLVDGYRPIGDRIQRDDVVVASRQLALATAGISGKLVAPFVPAPFVDDAAERERATDTVLDPRTPAAERNAALERYGVDWLVLTPGDRDRLDRAGAFSDGSLIPKDQAPSVVIVRVAAGHT